MSYPTNEPNPQNQPPGPGVPGGYGQPNPPGGAQGAPGYGQAPSGAPGGYGQAAYGAPGGYPDPYASVNQPLRRPGTVTAGAVLTWIGSALIILLGLGFAAVGGSSGFADSLGLQDGATAVMVPVGLGVALFGVLAVVFAVLAFRGSKGGLIALTVLGGLYVLLIILTLAAGTSSPGTLVSLLWVVGATVLFWSGRQWYDAKATQRGGV